MARNDPMKQDKFLNLIRHFGNGNKTFFDIITMILKAQYCAMRFFVSSSGLTMCTLVFASSYYLCRGGYVLTPLLNQMCFGFVLSESTFVSWCHEHSCYYFLLLFPTANLIRISLKWHWCYLDPVWGTSWRLTTESFVSPTNLTLKLRLIMIHARTHKLGKSSICMVFCGSNNCIASKWIEMTCRKMERLTIYNLYILSMQETFQIFKRLINFYIAYLWT